MRKVLITGANGFIGSAVLKEMSKNHVTVIAVVRNQNSEISHIQGLDGVRIVYCEAENISKLEDIVPDRDIDAFIHLAWEGSTGDARSDYSKQLMNVKYAMDAVHVASRMNIKRYIGAGTLAEKDVLNYHAGDGAVPNAVSIYGIAKISMHFMTKAECTKLGIEHIWCYLSNTYGVGNTTGNFINFACRTMLSGKRAAFTAGEQMYDFVYITDTARAICAATEKGKRNTAYYLGSGACRKLKEYIKIIRDTIDPEIPLFLGEIPFNGIALDEKEFNTDKLFSDTGYKPAVDFEQGIYETVEWLKSLN